MAAPLLSAIAASSPLVGVLPRLAVRHLAAVGPTYCGSVSVGSKNEPREAF